MTDAERRIIEHATAQLRHAYAQIAGGHVGNVKKFADGLIAPQIQRLEAVLALSTAPNGTPPSDAVGLSD